jgi:SAM-dependent methyltransferase
MLDRDAALAALRERFEDWLAEHGADSPKALGWNDVASQELRFAVLAQVMEGDEPVTVADFGCGPGGLFAHLAARSAPPPLGGYVGYDIVPAFVELARAEHTDPRARFEVASEVTEDADYVLASGALSVRPGVADADWEPHLQDVLAGLWARARRGFAFNMLAREAQPPPEHIYVGDPVTWASWCSGALPDALVALRYGPPLPDFTVLVRRQGAARRTG